MILNSYAVLMAFVAVLRLLLGVGVFALGLSAWRMRGAVLSPEGRTALEDRNYLVLLLTLLLVALNLVSWPLLYLLLQSYVPEWPGVMCIYGVMQVGKDTLGSSHYLPGLLRGLQLIKPFLAFASGGWFVLYLLNRRTKTGAILPRLLLVLLPLGALATAEAATELTYLAIPKKEVLPPGGCCLETLDAGDPAAKFLPPTLVGAAGRPYLYAAYYGLNAIFLAALFLAGRGNNSSWMQLASLLVLGAFVLATSGLFLVEVAAPDLLGLPDHHCPYDLIPDVPEAVLAVVFFLAGLFFLGWAGLAKALATCSETQPFLGQTIRGLLQVSFWGFLASLTMLSLELALT